MTYQGTNLWVEVHFSYLGSETEHTGYYTQLLCFWIFLNTKRKLISKSEKVYMHYKKCIISFMFNKNCFRNIHVPFRANWKRVTVIKCVPWHIFPYIMEMVVAKTNEMLEKDNLLVMIECQLIWSKLVLAWVSIVVLNFSCFHLLKN